MSRLSTVAVLFLVLLTAVSVSAARLPQWATAVVGAAPPIPEGIAEDDYRTVLHELSITVHPDGKLTTRMRIARQVLISTAWYAGVENFGSGDNSRIKKLNAWHLPPRGQVGKRQPTEKSNQDEQVIITSGGSFTTDDLAHWVGGWDIRPGSLVFFEAVKTESPYDLSIAEIFFLGGPLVSGKVRLELPAGWAVKSDWLHYDGPEAVVSGGVHTWEIRDLAAVDVEELGDPLIASSPILIMSILAPSGTTASSNSLPEWNSVAGWYDELAGGMSDPDDAIRSAAAGLAGDGDYVTRVISLASEVRDKVRYVAKEVGIEGYKPRPAADTWKNLYGDCKDKATLLEAMLASRDIDSYQVWVSATLRDIVSETVPGPGLFNHQILAVSLPPEADQGLPDLPAVLPESPLGPLLIIDTTDATTTPGWLPSHLIGKKALVLTEKEGYILELPAWKPEAHQFHREVRIRPLANGAWHFIREERRYGEYASSGRARCRRSVADRETSVFRWVKEHWTGAEPGSFQVEEERPDGAYVETVEWTVPRLAGRFEMLELPPFPDASSVLPTVSVTRRAVPVVYGFPRTFSLTVVVENLPPEARIPEPGRREGDGWHLETEWSRQDGEVRGSMKFVLEKTRFTKEEFRDLRRMYAALKKQAAELIQVPRGS